MADDFDPYRKWLGIPADEQPPNHYRLLGIGLFEDDADTIETAADRQMGHLRTFQTGLQSALSQKLLNECATAKICLLNLEKKAAYDHELRRKLAPPPPKPLPPNQSQPKQPFPKPPLLRPPAASIVPAQSPTPIDLSSEAPGRRPTHPSASNPAAPATAYGIRSQSPRRRNTVKKSKPPSLLWLVPLLIGLVLVALYLISSHLGGDGSLVKQAVAPAAAEPKGPVPPAKREKKGGGGALPTSHKSPKPLPDTDVVNTRPANPIPSNPIPPEPKPAAFERPSEVGVVADQLVLWNQHNGGANDYGTSGCRVSLWSDGQEVWKQEDVKVAWAANEDHSVSLPLPGIRFDRLRVDITECVKFGGGLSEIEVLKDGRNLALGCPVLASGELDARFPATSVVDGVIGSSVWALGYWLADSTHAWVEADLSLVTATTGPGVLADRVVIWNQHNGIANDRGANEARLTLWRNGREVWAQEQITIPWQPNADNQATVTLPKVGFDHVRVDVSSWHAGGGGLAEIQVFQGERNIALGRPAAVSASFGPQWGGFNATDGRTSSAEFGGGYWLLPDNTRGWVEVDVSGADPERLEQATILGRHLIASVGDWPWALRWLARGEEGAWKDLAAAELARPTDGNAQVALADEWRELAQLTPEPARRRLLAHALRWYVKAAPKLSELRRQSIRKRVAEELPALNERRYLYFFDELETVGTHNEERIRETDVVFDDRPSLYGLWMHPRENGSAHAKFLAQGKFRRLSGAAAIDDRALTFMKTPLTFRVAGDGRVLWTSQPLKGYKASQPFDIDVTGVKELELRVDCPGPHDHAFAAWLDPQLEE